MYLSTEIIDHGLQYLTDNANGLYICSGTSAPITYSAATGNNMLGYKLAPTVGAPAARTGGGREVTVSTITDGTTAYDGDAKYWALVDDTNSVLLISDALTAEVAVDTEHAFSLASFTIGADLPA